MCWGLGSSADSAERAGQLISPHQPNPTLPRQVSGRLGVGAAGDEYAGVRASGGHAAEQFAHFVHAHLVGFPVFALHVGFFADVGFELAPGEAADVGYGICGFEAFAAYELGEEGNECTQ